MKDFKEWKKNYFKLDASNRFLGEDDLRAKYDDYLQSGNPELAGSGGAYEVKGLDRGEGIKNMAIGGLVCIVGIVITAVSYSSASNGGSYTLAWGAILFGGIQFFRGLMQFLS